MLLLFVHRDSIREDFSSAWLKVELEIAAKCKIVSDPRKIGSGTPSNRWLSLGCSLDEAIADLEDQAALLRELNENVSMR